MVHLYQQIRITMFRSSVFKRIQMLHRIKGDNLKSSIDFIKADRLLNETFNRFPNDPPIQIDLGNLTKKQITGNGRY